MRALSPLSGCQATESEAACCLGLIPFIELFILWLLGPSTSAMAEDRCVACYLFICFTDLPSHSSDWVHLRAFGANDCPFNRGRPSGQSQFHIDRWWPFLFTPHFSVFLLFCWIDVIVNISKAHTASKKLVLLTFYTTPSQSFQCQLKENVVKKNVNPQLKDRNQHSAMDTEFLQLQYT